MTDNEEKVQWHCETKLEKYDAEGNLYETLEVDGNALMLGGASALFERLLGRSTVTAYDSTNAAIGVGDSSAATANTQTDLQATTNKIRKGMESSYPMHTDGTTGAVASTQFRASYGTAEANFTWNEWGIFNSVTAGSGRMLNRRVESLGTKVAGTTWLLTVTVSLAT